MPHESNDFFSHPINADSFASTKAFFTSNSTMKALQLLLSILGLLTTQALQSPLRGKHCSPSLPTDHPASIQFSAWIAAFNTGDKKALLDYHSDDAFPYSVASPDIGNLDHELSLSKGTGGFNIAEIESISEPSSVVVVLREKTVAFMHFQR
jgi:hypothetical protein